MQIFQGDRISFFGSHELQFLLTDAFGIVVKSVL